jgi:hypothetical protein
MIRLGVEPESALLLFGTVALDAMRDEDRPDVLFEELDLRGVGFCGVRKAASGATENRKACEQAGHEIDSSCCQAGRRSLGTGGMAQRGQESTVGELNSIYETVLRQRSQGISQPNILPISWTTIS